MKMTIKFMVALLCMVSLASLSSCSKDDTNNGSGSNGGGGSLLAGKWEVSDVVNETFGDINIGDIWEFKYMGTAGEDECYELYFKGGNFPIYYNGNELDMNNFAMWGVHTIEQLTSSTLKLKAKGDNDFFSSITLTKL